MLYTLISAAAMVALAVFLGIQNSSASVQQTIVDECNAALTTSPFTDVSVTELRDACSQDNAYYLRRTVMWTAIRAGIQVLPCCPHVLQRYLCSFSFSLYYSRTRSLHGFISVGLFRLD
jgi:hypothetical protein